MAIITSTRTANNYMTGNSYMPYKFASAHFFAFTCCNVPFCQYRESHDSPGIELIAYYIAVRISPRSTLRDRINHVREIRQTFITGACHGAKIAFAERDLFCARRLLISPETLLRFDKRNVRD